VRSLTKDRVAAWKLLLQEQKLGCSPRLMSIRVRKAAKMETEKRGGVPCLIIRILSTPNSQTLASPVPGGNDFASSLHQ
jgi:hypothetical protein